VSRDRRHSPACPTPGPGGRARTRNPARGRTRPPPPTTTTTTKEGGEPHATPSLELRRQVEEDGGCEATDGCFVEPDATCDHGQPSWLLDLGLI
jgi:hypothetical protein